MRLVGIVITYFPNFSELKHNIISYIDDVDVLIIWENTPDSQKKYSTKDLQVISSKIIILGGGNNIGIGSALNQGAKWLLNNGYDYLITFDQDSSFGPDMLRQYKKNVSENKNSEIGIFGSNYISNEKLAYENENNFLIANECITSGSIFHKSIFQKGLFFDENLFIDAVDFEYCYRAYKKANLKTAIITNIVLNHKIGYSDKSFLSKISDNYSAFRTYYLIRNQIYIWRKYPDLFGFKRKIHLVVKYIGLRYISVLFFENNKFSKLKSITKGIRQGLSKP